MYRWLRLLALFSFCISCKKQGERIVAPSQSPDINKEVLLSDTIVEPNLKENRIPNLAELHDTLFIRLKDFSDGFLYDMRYATTSNFLKAKVYDCAECYVRVKTVRALIKANEDFKQQGLKIKFFDCYRPNDVQWKMWELVPNPQYVANPAKGSIHNKGGAVDITLVSIKTGEEVPMGTNFDFFGKKAHHDYLQLPKEVLENRKILRETMEKYGFWSIRTEWWHYNLTAASNEKVANFIWDCPD